jgi:CheY-like chemotaxis protein
VALLSVLVVDDDAAIRDAVAGVLESEGFEVRSADNGEAALDAIRADGVPDLMILDLMMPVLSGWEVLEIVDTLPELRELPILVLSAMCTPVSQGCTGGVRACLGKPVGLEALVDAVRGILRPQPLPREYRPAVAVHAGRSPL